MEEKEIEEIEKHMKEIMKILNIKIGISNMDTPKRIAKMWYNELFRTRNDKGIHQLDEHMALFPNTSNDLQTISTKGIPFHSICEHHWLPFSGVIDVCYVPDENIIGLSKIPRVVEYFSKRPQLQEKLMDDIGKYLWDVLKPISLSITAEAKHQCVMCRGAESDCSTITYWKKYDDSKRGYGKHEA